MNNCTLFIRLQLNIRFSACLIFSIISFIAFRSAPVFIFTLQMLCFRSMGHCWLESFYMVKIAVAQSKAFVGICIGLAVVPWSPQFGRSTRTCGGKCQGIGMRSLNDFLGARRIRCCFIGLVSNALARQPRCCRRSAGARLGDVDLLDDRRPVDLNGDAGIGRISGGGRCGGSYRGRRGTNVDAAAVRR